MTSQSLELEMWCHQCCFSCR